MEATTEVHQWILVLFSLVFGGLLILSIVDRRRIKRRDKQLIESSIRERQLSNEVDYLIDINWNRDPIVVEVKTLHGISKEEILTIGTTTSTYSDDEVEAAIRVHAKFATHCSIYNRKEVIYLNPRALDQSGKKIQDFQLQKGRFLAVIGGALKQEQKTA